MKKGLFFLFCITCTSGIFAQKFSGTEKKILQKKEDSLKIFSVKILQAQTAEERLQADSNFTKTLVRALQTPYSFYFPFDSLKTISILTPPDSSFRIFTWQLIINNSLVRKHGAIQMNTADGKLKLFPLIDYSPTITKPRDTISTNIGWLGAVYYQLIEKKSGDKRIYTLLGYDENNVTSSRKMIEVLHFENDKPIFGGSYFIFPKDSLHTASSARYIMEYKKDASPRLTYDSNLKMIVMEHLVSETDEPEKESTFIGDGDYDAFKWENGKWKFVHKIYTQVTPLGQEPVPVPFDNEK